MTMTRVELIDVIGHSSVAGHLGLFVGTGFSKAATDGDAPTFEDLVRRLIDRLHLGIDIDADPSYRLKSLPQLASSILSELMTLHPPKEQADERFRGAIANICNLTPSPATRPALAAALSSLRPAWIITTNYDLILEALIDSSMTLLYDQPLVPNTEHVPVYHLHGHRLMPSSIRITEEDYVSLLGPIDYQRLRLPLILLESTTLMLGYALGDINVRAAMAWARSFRGTHGVRLAAAQGAIIQALYNPAHPNPDPYEGPNGEIILEVADLRAFVEELAARRIALAGSLQALRNSIVEFFTDPANADAVAVDGAARTRFLEIVERALPFSQATQVIDFLNRALDPIWMRARADGGFDYYDVYLRLAIDILARIDIYQCSPALLAYLADALERIGWYIDADKHYGTAWVATDTWIAQHHRLSDALKGELKSYGRAYWKGGLNRMMALA